MPVEWRGLAVPASGASGNRLPAGSFIACAADKANHQAVVKNGAVVAGSLTSNLPAA